MVAKDPEVGEVEDAEAPFFGGGGGVVGGSGGRAFGGRGWGRARGRDGADSGG